MLNFYRFLSYWTTGRWFYTLHSQEDIQDDAT